MKKWVSISELLLKFNSIANAIIMKPVIIQELILKEELNIIQLLKEL